jgi:hypothetical protein
VPDQLLDRQARLVEHLTSAAGIFGAARGISNDPALHGLDLALLHLEARFSHEKRMQKIEWVLTRTLALLGDKRAAITREFVDTCPPTGISWLENARQFHEFLEARWRTKPPHPPYLPDVAAYELAYATVRSGERRASSLSEDSAAARPGMLRRHPGAVLLRCAFDIRPILEGRGDNAPVRHELGLAVTMLPGTDAPQASEISPGLFEFLEMLEEFVDPAIFQDTPNAENLILDLIAGGLIEVRK